MPITLEATDLKPLLSNVLGDLEPQAREKEVSIQVAALNGLPPVVANERALDQVLINLVDNAIKYSPNQGEIRIDASADADSVTLDIGNNGPPIPTKHLPRIFERFYRVDPGRSRALGGTGLGLSIVKHQVSRMGGTVEVRSEPDGWTTFRVGLQRADRPTREL